MNHRAAIYTALTFAVVTFGLAGCGDSSKDSSYGASPATTTTPAAAADGITVKITDTPLGKVLTDSTGQTLYLFTPDTSSSSACTGDCAAAWPPLPGPVSGDGIDAADLGMITRDDGTDQATFHGHPVYYYAADGPGEATGQGSGGKWFVLGADGNPVKDATTTTAAADDGGY
jgi:predicted lipoprotein with Yx(FWY)xxD motif